MAKPKAIVIVESPTKIKTITKILGNKFKVLSSMGHLIDLPKSTLGVDVDNSFKPKLIVVRSKQKHLTKLKKDTDKAPNTESGVGCAKPEVASEVISLELN